LGRSLIREGEFLYFCKHEFGKVIKSMFKNTIAPIQAWLLSQERCTGCGAFLKESKRGKPNGELRKVTCKCGRAFIYNQTTKKYQKGVLK